MPKSKSTKPPLRRTSKIAAKSAPTQSPPRVLAPDPTIKPYFPPEPTITRPRDLTPEELALSARSSRASVAPTLSPPAEAFGSGGGAWHTDQRVNALWVNAEERNAWVNITAVGWKQLANSADSAVTALTIIGAQAKQSQTRVDYRDEADGMIHEMYLW